MRPLLAGLPEADVDLFYYGNQDVPPPSRRKADAPPPHPVSRPGVCEACGAPVPASDLASGRASWIYGVVLCQTCRLRASAEERVELYFCDRCQVSVPVYRVDTGEALAGDGRILCVECRRRSGRRVGRALLLVALLALLGLLAGSRIVERAGASRAASDPGPVVLDRLDRLLARLDELEEVRPDPAGLGAIREALESLAAEAEGATELLEQAGVGLARSRIEIGRRLEILEAETAALLRDVEEALRAAAAER